MVTEETHDNLIDPHCAPVGIESIDEELRGLEKGSIVAVVGDPMSQAPLFLRHLPSTNPTNYFSTYQPTETVSDRLLRLNNVEENDFELHDVYDIENDSVKTQRLIHMIKQARRNNKKPNTIIDSITSLPNLSENYTKLIRELQQTARQSDGLTYIYFARDGLNDLTDTEKEILHGSDVVIQLRTEVRSENIYHELILTKALGKQLPNETIRLDYGETININTTSRH